MEPALLQAETDRCASVAISENEAAYFLKLRAIVP